MGSNISIIGALERENIRGIHLYSLGEGFKIDFIYRGHPRFQHFIEFRNGVSEGGYFVVVVELDNGAFYRKTVRAGTAIPVNNILVYECLVPDSNWRCVCGYEMTAALNCCQLCQRNYCTGLMIGLGSIPIVGIPFIVTTVVLSLGNVINRLN